MLAADALDAAAVRRVGRIKRRPPDMGITVIVPDLQAAERYVEVTARARALADAFLPGPLTLVLTKTPVVPEALTGGRPTLGIRVPDHAFSLALAERLGRPVTATSANLSGGATPHTLTEALSQIPRNALDLVIEGDIPTPGLSTIVDLSVNPPAVLRQGLITESRVRQALGA
jgi:L-threonylcarbamoyladenylate synthase